jgi:hypothetical protein
MESHCWTMYKTPICFWVTLQRASLLSVGVLLSIISYSEYLLACLQVSNNLV